MESKKRQRFDSQMPFLLSSFIWAWNWQHKIAQALSLIPFSFWDEVEDEEDMYLNQKRICA